MYQFVDALCSVVYIVVDVNMLHHDMPYRFSLMIFSFSLLDCVYFYIKELLSINAYFVFIGKVRIGNNTIY